MKRALCHNAGRLYISEDEWEEYQESVERIWPEVDQLWNLLGQSPV